MSVSLIVVEPKSIERSLRYIPLATEEVFERVWLEGARQLGARWLSLFRPGVDLASEDFDSVSAELAALRTWVESAPLNSEEKVTVSQRIDALVTGLSRIAEQAGGRARVFIG
jgi:hypothetical protein